jgi:hypothetical protein
LQDGVQPINIAATPSVPIHTVFGSIALKFFMAFNPSLVSFLRLQPPDAAGP